MTRTYEITCSNAHDRRVVARVHDLEDGGPLRWVVSVRWCDLTVRDHNPLDGWRFRCRCGEYTHGHTTDMTHVLTELGDRGIRQISIRGIDTLRRMRPPAIRDPKPTGANDE